MKIKITVPVPGAEAFVTHVEVSENGDTVKAIRAAQDLARKANPGCLIVDHNIKLESR